MELYKSSCMGFGIEAAVTYSIGYSIFGHLQNKGTPIGGVWPGALGGYSIAIGVWGTEIPQWGPGAESKSPRN